jgi:nucleotide-binding universal stress UspA family protein
MGQKVLIAFDDSGNAMRAAQFVAGAYSPGHEITLLSVVPDAAAVCDMNSPELTPYFLEQRDTFCTMEDVKKDLLKQASQKAKDLLVEAGFDENKITIKIEAKQKGVARDIVAEARYGYDAIVLGKRGISGIKDFLLGSISQKVLHAAKGVSVVLVD